MNYYLLESGQVTSISERIHLEIYRDSERMKYIPKNPFILYSKNFKIFAQNLPSDTQDLYSKSANSIILIEYMNPIHWISILEIHDQNNKGSPPRSPPPPPPPPCSEITHHHPELRRRQHES